MMNEQRTKDELFIPNTAMPVSFSNDIRYDLCIPPIRPIQSAIYALPIFCFFYFARTKNVCYSYDKILL